MLEDDDCVDDFDDADDDDDELVSNSLRLLRELELDEEVNES